MQDLIDQILNLVLEYHEKECVNSEGENCWCSDFATEERLDEDVAEEFEKFNTTFLSEMLDEEIHFYLCGLIDGLKMFAMTEEADYEDLPRYGILHQTVERTE